MSALCFDAAAHVYTLNGADIPSVTDVLRIARLSDVSRVPPRILEHARWRGEQVHIATHYYDEGDLNCSTVPLEALPYVMAWIDFREEYGFKPELIEHRSYKDGEYPFGFCVDRVGTIGGERWLLDIKCTYAVMPHWGVQTAAYSDGLDDVTLRRGVVHLKKDRKFKLLPHALDVDYETWRYALAVTHAELLNGRSLKG